MLDLLFFDPPRPAAVVIVIVVVFPSPGNEIDDFSLWTKSLTLEGDYHYTTTFIHFIYIEIVIWDFPLSRHFRKVISNIGTKILLPKYFDRLPYENSSFLDDSGRCEHHFSPLSAAGVKTMKSSIFELKNSTGGIDMALQLVVLMGCLGNA